MHFYELKTDIKTTTSGHTFYLGKWGRPVLTLWTAASAQQSARLSETSRTALPGPHCGQSPSTPVSLPPSPCPRSASPRLLARGPLHFLQGVSTPWTPVWRGPPTHVQCQPVLSVLLPCKPPAPERPSHLLSRPTAWTRQSYEALRQA